MSIVDPRAEIVRSYWKGEQPLWQAFWLNGIVFAGIIFSLLILAARAATDWAALDLENDDLLGALIMFSVVAFCWLVMGLYYLWMWISIWRCAPNTGQVKWMYIARTLIVVDLVGGVIFLGYRYLS